jgi:23S rRNA (pseudouridine1915-N3)-methyltransferase
LNLTVIKIGKVDTLSQALGDTYQKRLRCFANAAFPVLKNESEVLKSKNTQHLIACEEGGRKLSSADFALELAKIRDNPQIKSVAFVVGGPYGLSSDFRNRCDQEISLAHGTLPSHLAWIVCLEQIYRAFTILNGSSYHH